MASLENNLDLTGASANGELPYHQQFGSTSTLGLIIYPNYMTVTGAGGSTSIDPSDYDQANNVVYAPVGDTNWWDEISNSVGCKITSCPCLEVPIKGNTP